MTGQVKHLKSGLVAIETKLGWTLMGQLPGKTRSEVCSLVVSSLISCDASISNLWSLEAIGINDPTETSSRAELELAAKEHFLRTVRVNEEGRYEVHLPWVEGHPKLGINRDIAEKRLLATTAKLKAGGRFEDYAKVFEEWPSSGVIEVVPDDGAEEVAHYLPHRAVFKESSSTTKVRPVFDASAHAKGFPSLNDCLEKGPNLIEQILVILIGFREKRIGVVSDIAKGFLQLSVTSRDRNFLRFYWWENSLAKKIRAYRHRRVIFGVSSSPFLLGAVLEQQLCNAPVHLKRTAALLQRSFYVDNCVSCVDDQDELAMFIQESQELLEMGKFDLRGWEFTLPRDTVAVDQIQDVPVLGLLWNKLDDTLRCDVKGTGQTEALMTKRKVLSVTHQVFDPLGILCPVTLQTKRLLQATWKSKSAWDTELPREITETFVKRAEEIHLLNEIRIPRWLIGSSSSRNSWSLHTFSNASKAAYAACVFLRAKTERGIVTQLVLAKSRVAPTKNVSIPRLELLSCVMGTRLANVVMDCLNLHDSPRFYWTDSSTALSWIKRDDQWATFVGNRVKEIRFSTSVDQWKHVPGNLNPADLPSRGCTSRQLLNSRWWEGPVWLKASPNEWPVPHLNCDEQEVNKKKRKTVSSLLAATTGWGVISKHFEDLNVYDKIVRRIAWLSRFSLWIRKKKNHYESSCLLVDELDGAEKKLLLAVQKEAFNPKLDFSKGVAVVQGTDGIYRVKSRLTMSEETADFKSPVIIPANHPVTTMLVEEHHLRCSHAGIQVMMASLRERFWIMRSRRTIRRVLKNCIRCQRFESQHVESIPAPLPKDRIREAAVFEIVGVDLACPLYLKGGAKSWVVIFTCAVYRAVHFELVTSLSTERFIMSLRRFVDRRGRPSIVYSDNGTNFVGTDNLFKGVDWNLVENYSTTVRIQWRFNPPTVAWWGGWWERIVRMMKTHLRKVLGKASLDYEELNTILADTEEVINSRPLTYMSDDMDDLCPISPSLFLKEVRKDGVPEDDVANNESLNKKWKHRQKLREDLRKRFRSEYLSQLVQKAGHNSKNMRPLKVGEIVLIGSDNLKRLYWPLAKVLEVIPGRDGNSRVARVKTAVGEYLRPLQRLYPLEISSLEEVNADIDSHKLNGKEEESVLQGEVEDTPVQVIKTRSGRVVKAPLKYVATYVSLFSHLL